MEIKTGNANAPQWRELTVKSRLPEQLKCLDGLTHNMWFSWNHEACSLFKSLDEKLYEAVGHNPVLSLERLDYNHKEKAVNDAKLMKRIRDVHTQFHAYMDIEPNKKRPLVAYFCMEYSINQISKIYSGGLGMLAGDCLREASDSNVDMCTVGLLYRYGYFKQSLNMEGKQIAQYEAQNFNPLPIEHKVDENGNPIMVDVPYLDYVVRAYIWRVNVGRIKLYLLDTDNDLNSKFDRSITHALYGGDWENRLKQKILLDIGGILTLKKLGIKKDIYHCNEGHAALCNLQHLCDYIGSGLTFSQAMELVRASSLYIVHTPVPAGRGCFDETLFGKYMQDYPQRLGITRDELIGMGRQNSDDHTEKFCVSTFACNTAQEVNGVSKLCGWVSQKMFAPIQRGSYPEESHVEYMTNGVYFPAWTSTEFRDLYDKYFDKSFMSDQSNEDIWYAFLKTPDEEIWQMRMKLKNKLVKYIREKLTENWLKNQGDPSRVMSLLECISPDALMIGFCRRFVTYKRAHLLFTDINRLSKIVNNPERPMPFFFSGKAHPADGASQDLIKRIYEISQRPGFLGKIILLEDYDMYLARRLVSGVDIWMNTSTRPLEASGMSSEKVEMNGVVNLSVLDGWWVEGYREGAGWALPQKRTYQNQEYQDQLDAATIYSLLENEIIPMYYNKNEEGYNEQWLDVVKKSVVTIAPHYTMKRQLDDYYDKFYEKQAARLAELAAEDAKLAREIAHWKETAVERQDAVHVVSEDTELLTSGGETGVEYHVKYVIDEQGLEDAVGLELATLKPLPDDEGRELYRIRPFEMTGHEGNQYAFEAVADPDDAGTFKSCVHIFPKYKNLPYRQDFNYVKWLD